MGKEEDKKEINLLPEDLRSKESDILSRSKTKTDFDFDFVSPDGLATKPAEKTKSSSMGDKIKKVFSRPKRFGQASPNSNKNKKLKEDKEGERPKIIYNPHENKPEISREEKTIIQLADKVAIEPKQNFQEDHKDNLLNDIKPVKPVENEEKKQGSSIWDKLKKIFVRQPKVPKLPKVTRVPAKPIVARDIKDINQTGREPDSMAILNESDIKTIPETLVQQPVETKKPFLAQQLSEEQIAVEKESADFSIPALDNNSNQQFAKEKEFDEKKQIIPQFHHPQPRIRARLLDNGGGVDLIPTSAKTRSWQQIVNLLLVACLGSIFIVGIFYGFLFYQAKNIEIQKANRAEQITSLEKQIIDYKNLNNNITQLGNEIKSIHKLLSFHFYWTNFFQLLEKYTIADVYYAGLTAGNGGALTLQATATDFDALARQIKVLQEEEASEFVVAVDVPSAKYNEATGYIDFDMTVVLNPLLFVYNENYIYEIDNYFYTEGDGEQND